MFSTSESSRPSRGCMAEARRAHAELAQQRSSLNPALELQRQAKSRINAMLPNCRLIGICGHAPKVSVSAGLNGSETGSRLSHVVRIVEKLSINSTLDFQRTIHLTSDCLRGGSNLRIPDIPTFRRTLGISRSENGSV
jgi:hypothetical protein